MIFLLSNPQKNSLKRLRKSAQLRKIKNLLNTKQILLFIAAIAIIVVMFSLGRTNKKDSSVKGNNASLDISFEDYISVNKSNLLVSEQAFIDSVLSSNIPDEEKFLKLSKAWEDIGNYSIGAYYFHLYALKIKDYEALEKAGDKMIFAFKNYPDSLNTNNLITFALASYKAALEEKGSDVGLRMKLAEVYVEEGTNPMEGITILMSIADSLPKYIPAQLTLGRLAITSGQYGKAESRLAIVLTEEPENAEAIYFMAIAKEGLGKYDEAINLFEICKKLVANPLFDKEIDSYIIKLKNKKD
jgi:tetratricopeptide (TPR) repeat protein